MRLIEFGQFFYALPSPRGKEHQSLCPRIYVASRSRRNSYKRVDPKQCTICPVSDIKVCNQYGRCSIEVQFQSLFQDQTVSWIRIVNGIDKFVREAMPIQEEEKASGKPAAKARPLLKSPSSSGWDFTPIEHRQWIDIETLESKDPYCFQVSKFTTRSLRHSQKVFREEDGGVHYDQVIDERKKKQSDNTGYLADEIRSTSSMLSIGQLTNGYQFWQKEEDRRNGFNIA